jgi:hypothetical protein
MWRGLVGVRFLGVGLCDMCLCDMYGFKPEISNKTHHPQQQFTECDRLSLKRAGFVRKLIVRSRMISINSPRQCMEYNPEIHHLQSIRLTG